MRIPPLLADFIYNRGCELKCEKFLTRPRTQVLISWYDKSDKYVIMAVAYDEDVSTITYLNQELIQLNVNGYRLFLGYGIGEYDEMHMFDKNGNCLEQIKE